MTTFNMPGMAEAPRLFPPNSSNCGCPVCRAAREGEVSAPAPIEPCAPTGHPPGVKLDAGKPTPRLIVQSMPRAMLAISEVGAYGAAKYSPDGWVEVPDGFARYTDAMLRHLLAEGITSRDEESGLLHAAHAAWGAIARLELLLRRMEQGENM